MIHKNICIINGEMKEDYSDGYIIGAEKRANELGYRTTVFSMMCSGMVDTNNEECVYSYINFDDYDGVLFVEHSFSAHKHIARSVEGLLKEKSSVPIVSIGNSDVSEDCFALDSMNDFEAITDHLIVVHGCTRIYCLGGNRENNNRRVDGFEKSILKHGLNPEECVAFYGGYWTDCAEKLAKDIACGNVEMPEAVVCITDIVALALIKALFNQGIRVPEDIRVCGYNAHPSAFNNLISITTFPVNTKGCGAEAMNRLHELICGEKVPLRQSPSYSIITGKSCGCGSQSPSNLRFRLAEAEKDEQQNVYFRNSRLEELFVGAGSVEEIAAILKDKEYLIPDSELLSLNLLDTDGTTVCRYLTNSIVGGDGVQVEEGVLFPKRSVLPDNVRNYHVLPIVYAGVNYGYLIAGYEEALVHNKYLKRFCRSLALGCRVLFGPERQVTVRKLPGGAAEEPTVKSADTVFGKKNNVMHRLSIE
ncbi:MAG: LacI family DNA-binding transcriptional regulator, partial [Lachnospiraceae bacterium]|nr:LacI family DNA-binding transcriptional regulator [Lachnospiraceae bacterium]